MLNSLSAYISAGIFCYLLICSYWLHRAAQSSLFVASSVLIFSLSALLSPQPVEADSHPPWVCFWFFHPKREVYFIYYVIYLFIYCEALAEEEFFVFFFKNLIAVTLPCNEANDFESLKLINCHLRFGTAILQQRVSTWKETWTSYGRTNHKQANNLDWLETES